MDQNFPSNKTVNFPLKINFTDLTHKNYHFFSCKVPMKKSKEPIEVRKIQTGIGVKILNLIFLTNPK